MKEQRINFAKEFKHIVNSNPRLVDSAMKLEGYLLDRYDEKFDFLITILIYLLDSDISLKKEIVKINRDNPDLFIKLIVDKYWNADRTRDRNELHWGVATWAYTFDALSDKDYLKIYDTKNRYPIHSPFSFPYLAHYFTQKRTLFKLGIPIVTVFVIFLFIYSVTNENTATPVKGIHVTTFSNVTFGIKNLTYPDTWSRTNILNKSFENVFGNTAIRLKPSNISTIDVGIASNPVTDGPNKGNTTRYLEFIAELNGYQNITYSKDNGNTVSGEPISSMMYEFVSIEDNSTQKGKVYAIAKDDKIYYLDYYIPSQFFETLVPFVDKMAKTLEIDPTVTISDELLYESYSNVDAGIIDIKYPPLLTQGLDSSKYSNDLGKDLVRFYSNKDNNDNYNEWTIDFGIAINNFSSGPEKDNTARYLESKAERLTELYSYQNITYSKDSGNTVSGEPISTITYEYFREDNSTQKGKVYAMAKDDKIYYLDYYIPSQFFETLVPIVDKMAKSLEVVDSL